MDIFDNDEQVLSIGNLTIENGTDKIIIHGDVEIAADDVGRQHAKMLYDFAKQLCQSLTNASQTNDQKSEQTQEIIDNPFA